MEELRLRVKDLDFDYGQLTVRSSKGEKDRRTIPPRPLAEPIEGGDAFALNSGCAFNGMPISCSEVGQLLQSGGARIDYVNNTWGFLGGVDYQLTEVWEDYEIEAPHLELGFDESGNPTVSLSGGLTGSRLVEQFVPVPQTGVSSNRDAGGRAKLTNDRLLMFKVSVGTLEAQLSDPNSDCAKFLRDKLGFSSKRVLRTLRGIRAFDGLESTITLAKAGSVSHKSKLANVQTDVYFRTFPGTNAVQARFASREDRGSSPSDIYFGIYFDASIILHEVLHVFTGLSDADLANRLKVTVTADNTGRIDDALKAGGCG